MKAALSIVPRRRIRVPAQEKSWGIRVTARAGGQQDGLDPVVSRASYALPLAPTGTGRAISSMVEQRTLNPEAESSSLSWPTENGTSEVGGLAKRRTGASRFLP